VWFSKITEILMRPIKFDDWWSSTNYIL